MDDDIRTDRQYLGELRTLAEQLRAQAVESRAAVAGHADDPARHAKAESLADMAEQLADIADRNVKMLAIALGTVDTRPEWHFYLPDTDRSLGWTSHGNVLQLVAVGRGDTAFEAWDTIKLRGDVPEAFELPESVVAIRDDAIEPLEVS